MQRSRLGSCGRNHGGVGHGAFLLQDVDDVGDSGCLLANGNIDAIYGFALFVIFLLVDDGVDGNGRFSSLAVADDKFALSASDGNHGVDSLEAGLECFVHRLAVNDARGLAIERHHELFAFDGRTAVDGNAQRIDDAAQHVLIDQNRGNAVGTLDAHSFLDALGGTEKYGADIVFFQVHGYGHYAVFEFNQLVFRNIGQTIDTGNAVADGENCTDFFKLDFCINLLQLLKENF